MDGWIVGVLFAHEQVCVGHVSDGLCVVCVGVTRAMTYI